MLAPAVGAVPSWDWPRPLVNAPGIRRTTLSRRTAPCSSSFAFSPRLGLVTSPSRLGRPSTRSFASLRPRPVSSRTPDDLDLCRRRPSDDVESVFSSATAAPPPIQAHRHRHHGSGGDGRRLVSYSFELRQLEDGHVAKQVEHLIDRRRHDESLLFGVRVLRVKSFTGGAREPGGRSVVREALLFSRSSTSPIPR